MAKHLSKMIEISRILWLPENNYARHDLKVDSEDERRKIATELAREGWSTLYPLKVVALTEAGVKRAMEFLEKQWESLQKLDVADKYKDAAGKEVAVPAELLRSAFTKRWMPKGKIVPPEYEGVYAFQRGSCLDLTNAYLLALNAPMIDSIPCIIQEYKTQAERVKDCAEENFGKDFLANKVTGHWPSIIKTVNAFYEASGKLATFSDIQGLVKLTGLAQKAHPIVVLNARFPELGIVDKIINAGTVKDGNVEHDLGQEYGASLDRARLIEFEQGTREKPVEGKNGNPKDIKDYFTNPSAGTQKPAVPMKAKDIGTLSTVSKNYLVRYVLACLADAKTAPENLMKLDKLADEHNAQMETLGFTKDGKPVIS